jgi:hypothetical protein
MDTNDVFYHGRRAARYNGSLSLSLTIEGYLNGPCEKVPSHILLLALAVRGAEAKPQAYSTAIDNRCSAAIRPRVHTQLLPFKS